MNKQLLKKVISGGLALEGFLHILLPIVSFWGMYKEGVWDIAIAITPLFDLVFAALCLTGSWLLGEKVHHH